MSASRTLIARHGEDSATPRQVSTCLDPRHQCFTSHGVGRWLRACVLLKVLMASNDCATVFRSPLASCDLSSRFMLDFLRTTRPTYSPRHAPVPRTLVSRLPTPDSPGPSAHCSVAPSNSAPHGESLSLISTDTVLSRCSDSPRSRLGAGPGEHTTARDRALSEHIACARTGMNPGGRVANALNRAYVVNPQSTSN